MPLGAHERAPAPPGRLRPPRAHRRRQSPANCASRPLSPAARSCLSRRAAPQRPSDACVAVGRPSSNRGAYAAAAWAVNGSLPRTLAGRSARARGRRGRVENYCLPRATLTVLLGGLTGRYTRRRWRKSGASCCRLSGQMPRTKGASGCERGSAKAMDETNKEVAGARSAAMERVKLLHTASPPPQFSAVFARCLWQSSVWMSPVSIVR